MNKPKEPTASETMGATIGEAIGKAVAKPPTCRELQAQINELREELKIAASHSNSLSDQLGQLNADKVSVKDSWTVTAAVQTGLETAQKYYERAEQAYNKIEPTLANAQATHTQALHTLSSALRLTHEIKKYAALPWYRRIFNAPHFSAEENN